MISERARATPDSRSHDAAQAVVVPLYTVRDVAVYCVSQDPELWSAITGNLPSELRARQFDQLHFALDALLKRPGAAVLFVDATAVQDLAVELAPFRDLASPVAAIEITGGTAEEIVLQSVPTVAMVVERLSRDITPDMVRTALHRARLAIEAQAQRRPVMVASVAQSDSSAAPVPASQPPTGARPGSRPILLGVIAVAVVAAGGWWFLRPPSESATVSADATALNPAAATAAARSAAASTDSLEQVLERARRAMLERRYLTPREDSALAHYQQALRLAPKDQEAQQGMTRLTELLLTRANEAFEQRQYDAALAALEGARELRPDDRRIAALDARVSESRGRIVEAQVKSAIGASAFDRAFTLLENARASRAMPEPLYASLRGELDAKRRQQELKTANDRFELALREGRLIGTQENDAESALGALNALDAPAGRAARTRWNARLLDEARRRATAGDAVEAERHIEAARAQGASAAALQSAQAAVVAGLEAARQRRAEQDSRAAAATRTERRDADSAESRRAPASAPAAAAPSVISVSQLKFAKPLKLKYPRSAERARTEGWVEMLFTVTSTGEVNDIVVTAAQPLGVFEESAVAALSDARFEPHRVDGVVVVQRARVKLTFRAP